MKQIKILFFITLTLVLMNGCNGRDRTLQNSKDGYQILNQLHDQVASQSFVFDGTTSIKGEDFNAQNLANFTGQIDRNRDIFINLSTAEDGNGIMEDMDYYAKGNQFYMRFADEVKWQPVTARSPLIEDEINHWNPIAHFERMSEMAQNIRHLDVGGKMKGVRVVLQPDKLKNEFIQNIRDRLEDQGTRENGIRFQSLSSGVPGEEGVLKELRDVQQTIQDDFNEMSNSLSISGEYIIYYDSKTRIPTKLTYTQTTDYTEGGERHSETSKLRYTFRDFGTNQDLSKLLK